MTYKEAITESMKILSEKKDTIFLGYNINYGSKAYSTLANVPDYKKLEMPVAENLISGTAIGLAIQGFKPIIFFERHDFILNALDSLKNHLDLIYKVPVIIRAVIGSKEPLYPGAQHCQDYTNIFKQLFNFIVVIKPITPEQIIKVYNDAYESKRSYMIIEDREKY